jgi:hypothetical protein
MNTRAALVTTSLLASLTACSGIPLEQRRDEPRARYESYAGTPIQQFTWFGHYDSWEPIGTNELVVRTTSSQAYLIRVAPPCENLEFTNRIEITSTANTVHTHFDFVKVGLGSGHSRCPIQEIRPLDYLKMRQDMRKEVEEAKATKTNTGA